MKKFMKVCSTAIAVVFGCLLFAGCVPSNMEKAKAKMEDAGYTVIAYESDDARVKAYEGAVGLLIATDGLNVTDSMTAILFDSTKSAKAAYDKIIEANKDTKVTQSGKWIYGGSEEAVEAFN